MGLFIRDWCGLSGELAGSPRLVVLVVARAARRGGGSGAPSADVAAEPSDPADTERRRPPRAAVTAVVATRTAPLRGIPAIRHFFRTNETPDLLRVATAFNLLGIDRWVRNFRFINYYDSFDGWHPNVFVPQGAATPRAFDSIEEICNYLLGHKEVVDFVARPRPRRQGRVPDVRRGDRGSWPTSSGSRSRSRRPSCGTGWIRRSRRRGSATRRACRACRTRWAGRRPTGRCWTLAARRGPRRRPRDPDAVRRLRADHVLRRERGRLEGRTRRRSSVRTSR